MKTRILPFLIVVFAVGAGVVCFYLMRMHMTGVAGPSWFDAGCSAQPGATANCAAVLQSPYSYIPPKFPDASEAGRAPVTYVPVAYLGLLYYTVLALWFVGIGAPTRGRAWLHLIPTVLLILGIGSSLYFLYLMFTKLDAWCPWCVVTHTCNAIIAVCVVLLWPAILRRTETEPARAASRGHSEGAPTTAETGWLPQPSGRVVLMTAISIIAGLFALGSVKGMLDVANAAQVNKRNAEAYAAILKQIKSDPVLLATHWERTPEIGIARRPDDPARVYKPSEASQPPLDVVVFSDFECPSCASWARFFEAQAMPMFGGHVQVTFKHYPIDQSCNSKAGGTLHPHACEVAKMAEAVRILGGNDAFWRAHDYLFNNRLETARGKMTAERLATELKLDPQALTTTMKSKEVAGRIVADCEQAAKFGITGTPAVYVEGRVVSQLAKGEAGFWNALADMYWNGINVPRPESTKQKPKAPTAESPDSSQ